MTDSILPLSVCTLWYKPGPTMQGLIKNGQGHGVALVVAMGFGLVQAGRFALADSGLGLSDYAGSLLAGLLAGLGALYLFAWLLRNFARWFGGQASQREVRIAVGWGLLPWTVLFLALIVALSGQADASALAEYYWLFFLGFLYGYVVLLLSLAAALNLSAMKTFLCLVVTGLVSVFPLTLLFQVVASVV